MKLVYCIAATYNSGGMERVLSCKANYWTKKGHEVIIITTDQMGRPSFFDFHPAIKCYDLGINYEANNGSSFISKLCNFPKKQRLHRQRLSALLQKLQADVVFSMFNNDVNFIADIKDGSKKVLEIHFSKNKKLLYGRKGLWALADRWRTHREEALVKKFDRFVVLTHEDATCWGDTGNLSIIPNPRTFKPKRPSPLTGKQILAIGRYDYQKGFDRLLQIWSEVNEEVAKDWQLCIVGHGPDKEILQAQIDQLGLQHRTQLMTPTNDVEALYHSSSIFVMTSRYEGLPMVLLEAQACGLPVVSYDFQCGPKDLIIEGGNGFIVPQGDTTHFAQRLMQLMQDTTLREQQGRIALQQSEQFTEENIMLQWEELLNHLTSTPLCKPSSSPQSISEKEAH